MIYGAVRLVGFGLTNFVLLPKERYRRREEEQEHTGGTFPRKFCRSLKAFLMKRVSREKKKTKKNEKKTRNK